MRRFRLETLEQRHMLAATPLGDALLVNEVVTGGQQIGADAEAVAPLASGGFVAAYAGRGPTDQSGVSVRQFDADGVAVGSAQQVNTTSQGEQVTPSIASFDDGSFVAVWAGRGTGDKEGVFARWFDEGGAPVSPEVLVNTTVGGRQFNPQVATTSEGNTIITWQGPSGQDSGGVLARLFGPDRQPLTDELQVNSQTSDDQGSPAVATAADGSFLVAFASRHEDGSDWGVFARQYDASGVPSGDPFLVNETTTGSQLDPSVTSLGSDGFVVGWTTRISADDADVRARRFDANGQPAGGEFTLNELTDGQQYGASLAAIGNGGLLAAWTSDSTTGNGAEVRAREFDAGDLPVAGQFDVNPTADGANLGHQSHPSVAVRNDLAIIAWSGRGTADHQGVFAQRFELDVVDNGDPAAPNLAPIADGEVTIGTEFSVTVTATDDNPLDTLTFLLDTDNSPTDATLEQLDNNSAIIRWTPDAGDLPGPVGFRVIVTDDGTPTQSDVESFEVTLIEPANLAPQVDLNGDDPDSDFTATFNPNVGFVLAVDTDLAITDTNDSELSSAVVRLTNNQDGLFESVGVDVSDTSIEASYDLDTSTLTLTGADTLENYQLVLRTLTYSNIAAGAITTDVDRIIEITVNDGELDSPVATSTIVVPSST